MIKLITSNQVDLCFHILWHLRGEVTELRRELAYIIVVEQAVGASGAVIEEPHILHSNQQILICIPDLGLVNHDDLSVLFERFALFHEYNIHEWRTKAKEKGIK